MANNYRSCYLLIFNSILIGILLYSALMSYYETLERINNVEIDLGELYKSVMGSSADISIRSGRNSLTLSSEQKTKDLVKMETQKLRSEIGEIKDVLNKMYGVQLDKDLRVDYAMESIGTRIAYIDDNPYCSMGFLLSLFGIRSLMNEPRNMLKPHIQPGACYAFRGRKSVVVLQLVEKVFIDSVAIEHILDIESPDGLIKSAPRDFEVYGLTNLKDEDPFYFGQFTYDISRRERRQVFPVLRAPSGSYQFVQFRFLSNHGHTDYTCVYRISVFGKLDKQEQLL